MTEGPVSRRHLAAIMFTDIVGFSALTGRDEALALQLVDEHNRLLRVAFTKHDGMEIKSRGDGFHVEFPSALQAVNCAVEIQHALHERNRDRDDSHRLLIRIGIHLGDVDAQDGDVYGEAVNVAARIEPLAEPGGVAVSRPVVDQVSHRGNFRFVSLGQPPLKNIRSRVTVFRLIMPWSEARFSLGERLRRFVPWRAGMALLTLVAVGAVAFIARTGGRLMDSRTAFTPPAHSVAVLPFANMSGDANQDYFSDGLSEELLNALARVNELHVVARTSSFSFKGKDADIAAIARKLNVGAILQGSVRRADNKVRITAQLVNAQTGYQLWSQSYDRDMKDILALQTSVAESVTDALQVKLLGNAAAKFELGGTRNPEAFDAYLKGRKMDALGRNEIDARAELKAYDTAIALDPNYALAHAARARVLNRLAGNWISDVAVVRDTYDEARAAAERAVQLAPGLGEAHTSLGFVLHIGFFDFARAGAEYKEGLALAPGSAQVQRDFSRFANDVGRADPAVTAARRAVELDGLSPRVHTSLAIALYYARRYEAAITSTQQALSLYPQTSDAHGWAGFAYLARKKPGEAAAACGEEPQLWARRTCLAIAYHALNRQEEADAELTRLRDLFGASASYQYAEIYAQWGLPDDALASLATAMKVRDPGLTNIRVDPLMDPVRQDARFKAIEKGLNFP